MDNTWLEKGVELRMGGLQRYRLVYHWKNPDGSINWFNFLTGGSYYNLIGVLLVVSFLVLLVMLYKHDTAILVECCNACQNSLASSIASPIGITFP